MSNNTSPQVNTIINSPIKIERLELEKSLHTELIIKDEIMEDDETIQDNFDTDQLSYKYSSTTNLSNDAVSFKCSFCDKTFGQKKYLNKHEVIHTGEEPVKCDVCSKTFIRQASLTHHEKRIHSGKEPLRCNLCNKSFNYINALRAHIKSHTGKKLVTNEKSFTPKASLTHHEKSHPEHERFRCKLCNQPCRNCKELKAHIKSHTGEV